MLKSSTEKEILDFLSQIIGGVISSAWNAYGFTLYLEIDCVDEARLHALENATPLGHWSLSAESYWKFWKLGTLWIDSRKESRSTIDIKLHLLRDIKICSVQYISANIITLQLDNGLSLTVENADSGETNTVLSLVNNHTRKRITLMSDKEILYEKSKP